MLEQILSLILVGLGLQTPSLPPSVLGDEDIQITETQKTNTQSGEARSIEKTMLLEQRKQLQLEFKSKIETKRREAKQQFEAQRKSFKQRLETIKDERKKEVVERADTRISEINTKRTTQMTERLNNMDEVVTRLSQKIEDLQSQGTDVSLAQSSLADAHSKLSLAKSAVTAQAEKEYVIGITSENKLGQDISRSLEAFKNDVKTIETSIKIARESITAAIRQVALIIGDGTQEE